MTYIYRFTIKSTGQVYVGQHRSIKIDDPQNDNYKGSGIKWKELLKSHDLWEINKFKLGVKKEILKIWYKDVSREEVGMAEKEAIKNTRELYKDLFEKLCVNISNGSLPSWHYNTQEEAYNARKEWFENHREEIKEYRKINKEKITELGKKYRIAHKKELKEYDENYRHNHKEQKRNYDKQYRKINKEKLRIQSKEYRTSHKEELQNYRNNHKEELKRYKENNKNIIREKNKIYRQLPYVKIKNKVFTFIKNHNYLSPDIIKFPNKWGEAEITEYKRQYEKHNKSMIVG